MFIITFKTTCHLTPSCTTPSQSTSSQPISVSHLCLGLLMHPFPSGFTTNVWYFAFLISKNAANASVHIYFITLVLKLLYVHVIPFKAFPIRSHSLLHTNLPGLTVSPVILWECFKPLCQFLQTSHNNQKFC
jgi:hypothetical protein